MTYTYRFTPSFEKQLSKLKKKDKSRFQELSKKILQIVDNPEHYKPLKKPLQGTRRAHLGSHAIIYEILDREVVFHHVKHSEFYLNSRARTP